MTYTDDEQLAIANEIIRQLGGGGRLRAMIGAKDILAGEDQHGAFVRFRIGRNDARINRVQITLTPRDTYRVELGYVRGASYTVRHVAEDLYCDGLRDVIETQTGMYLSL